MSKGIYGIWQGTVQGGEDLIEILKEHELLKNPNSFLRSRPLVLKKISVIAPVGTALIINNDICQMPAGDFESAFGNIAVEKLVINSSVDVTITYLY